MSKQLVYNRLTELWNEINKNKNHNEFHLKTLECSFLLRALLPNNNWSISKLEPLINPYTDLVQNKIPSPQDWSMAMTAIKTQYRL